VRTGVSDELPAYIEDAGVDPAEIADVGTTAEPALERIAALEPDLILSDAVRHADIHGPLAAIAPTVFAEAIGETREDDLRLAGEASDDRWFLAIGPLGAGLVLDDLERFAAQPAG
jgi:iron complex transport system substrate-binding protein